MTSECHDQRVRRPVCEPAVIWAWHLLAAALANNPSSRTRTSYVCPVQHSNTASLMKDTSVAASDAVMLQEPPPEAKPKPKPKPKKVAKPVVKKESEADAAMRKQAEDFTAQKMDQGVSHPLSSGLSGFLALGLSRSLPPCFFCLSCSFLHLPLSLWLFVSLPFLLCGSALVCLTLAV